LDDETKGAIAFFGVMAMVWVGGYLMGRSSMRQKYSKIEPGVYVDGSTTASVLMTIGINALKDGLYDQYELADMISESEI